MRNVFRPGTILRVKALDHGHRASKQLIDMGITPDTLIHVEGTAPLGEPVIIRVRNYKLALRRRDLMALDVERQSPAGQ